VALLQPWKWQLTGIGYSTAAQASGAHCPRNGLWTRSYAARRTTPLTAMLGTPLTAMLGLRPVIRVPNDMDHYSFTDPEGWMAELAMLADR